MVMQFLHEAYLCLLLHGFVGRTVLAYAESIVAPNELDRNLHQCCHTHGGFHIVAEHKESTAGGDDTAVQCHTHAYTSHRQLAHAGLQESTGEITFGKGFALLQEAVRLV